MMVGKIPENVLKRSVLREIKNNNKDVITGASFGEDCAVLNLSDYGQTDDKYFETGSAAAAGEGLTESKIALVKACNNLYAGGFIPEAATLLIALSKSFEEENLKLLMRELNGTAKKEGITIVGGHTFVSQNVSNGCIVNVNALGKRAAGFEKEPIKAGYKIIASKWIGIEGSYILTSEYKSEIEERFRKDFTDTLLKNIEYIGVGNEAREAIRLKAVAMKDVSEHGIFGALYELAERAKCGVEVDLKAIPVRQDVIEIGNFFDINPYEMKSSGMLLMVAKDGETFVEGLKKSGIEAAVIGNFTEDNDKAVINGEEKRFLEKIKQDAIYKIKTVRKGD